MSWCQSETSAPLLSEHYSKPGRTRNLKLENWKYNTGVAQGALTWAGVADSMSLVHIRHFTMIQHVQLRLPCLQSRTKTTCNYQKYTFSSITWYVNKPTNAWCLCSLCWVNKMEENTTFSYFVGLWKIVERRALAITIWVKIKVSRYGVMIFPNCPKSFEEMEMWRVDKRENSSPEKQQSLMELLLLKHKDMETFS